MSYLHAMSASLRLPRPACVRFICHRLAALRSSLVLPPLPLLLLPWVIISRLTWFCQLHQPRHLIHLRHELVVVVLPCIQFAGITIDVRHSWTAAVSIYCLTRQLDHCNSLANDVGQALYRFVTRVERTLSPLNWLSPVNQDSIVI